MIPIFIELNEKTGEEKELEPRIDFPELPAAGDVIALSGCGWFFVTSRRWMAGKGFGASVLIYVKRTSAR